MGTNSDHAKSFGDKVERFQTIAAQAKQIVPLLESPAVNLEKQANKIAARDAECISK